MADETAADHVSAAVTVSTAAGEPPHGWIEADGPGSRVEFHGWLELIATIEQLRSGRAKDT
jgi:hypothetical protein